MGTLRFPDLLLYLSLLSLEINGMLCWRIEIGSNLFEGVPYRMMLATQVLESYYEGRHPFKSQRLSLKLIWYQYVMDCSASRSILIHRS